MDAGQSTLLPVPLVLGPVAGATALAPEMRQTAFLYRRGSLGMRESALLGPEEVPVTASTLPLIEPCLVGAGRMFELFDYGLGELVRRVGPSLSTVTVHTYLLLDTSFGASLEGGELRSAVVGREVQRRLELALGIPTEVQVSTGDALGFAELLPEIAETLVRRSADVALVVALHSDLEPVRIAELAESHRLYGEEDADGLIPGEAAVFLTLSTPEVARRLGFAGGGEILGVASATDRARPDNDESAYEALALTYAFRKVVSESLGGPVGWVLSDVGRESHRIQEYQAILARSQDLLTMPQMHDFPAQSFGHLGAATAPLHVALASLAFAHGYAPSSSCVSLAGRDDGGRSCIGLVGATWSPG